jgi:hypothetical protein
VSVVRLDAMEALARIIGCEIPLLEGHICVGQAPSSEVQEYPHLSIDPAGRWNYDPQQQEQKATLPGGRTVYNVGDHEVSVQLRLVTTTPRQRAELEQRVIDIFLAGEDPVSGLPRPGVVVVHVSACPALYRWPAAFELEGDEWDDEKAFDAQLTSIVTVRASIPALVTRCGEYTIQTLRLGIINDLEAPVSPAMSPPVEVVQIHEDGSITPVS